MSQNFDILPQKLFVLMNFLMEDLRDFNTRTFKNS